MADDTQVPAKIINEQVEYSYQNGGGVFAYSENLSLHLNTTSYDSSGPNHFVEQGTLTETYRGTEITGRYSITENDNHVTSISDFSYTQGGNTYEYKSDYTSNGSGYNLVEQQSINGVQTGVFHYNSNL